MALEKFPSRDAPSVTYETFELSQSVFSNYAFSVRLDHVVELVYNVGTNFLNINFYLEDIILGIQETGLHSGDENDDGKSVPLNYNMLVHRYPHIENDHLLKLLKQLISSTAPPSRVCVGEMLQMQLMYLLSWGSGSNKQRNEAPSCSHLCVGLTQLKLIEFMG
ncbi:hypothetical protein GBA52_004552 [Prunus armeniaca]|nr:hypothetical protein GBA52_004552 [Prunus armeniaca]